MLTSVWAREWHYKVVVNDMDGLMWEDFSQDSQKFVTEGGESAAL